MAGGLKPLGDNVLVRPEGGVTKSKGGILIPDQAQEKPCKGLVLEVGPGGDTKADADGNVWSVPINVKAGDTVYFTKYGGHEVEVNGEALLVIGEKNLLAVAN